MELRLKLADDMQERITLVPLAWPVYDTPALTYAEFLDEHELLLSEALARAFVRATDYRRAGWLWSQPF